MNTNMEDDDRSSSADGFSLVDDHQNKADDFDVAAGIEKALLEPPSKSTSKQATLVEVAKVNYRDFYVGIYTDVASPRNSARRFFYDPIVHLDLSSIVSAAPTPLSTQHGGRGHPSRRHLRPSFPRGATVGGARQFD